MIDLISREVAVKAVHEEFDGCLVWDESVKRTADEVEMILDRVPAVPSQPEIIRCKDCKYYKANKYDGKLACHYVIGGTVIRNLNDFCSRAERITDE